MTPDPATSTSTSTPSIASKDGTRVAIHGVGFATDAADRLEEMGYTQEMKRSLGMVSILGLSFAIMAVSSLPFATRSLWLPSSPASRSA